MSETVFVLTPNDTRQLETFRRFLPEDAEITWIDVTQSIEAQAAQLKDAVAVIAAPSAFPIDLALACPNLKLIQTVSAGTNMLDIPALNELGIRVANNGGGNAVAVAEHTILLMVSVYRKMQLQLQSVQDRQWSGDLRATWFPRPMNSPIRPWASSVWAALDSRWLGACRDGIVSSFIMTWWTSRRRLRRRCTSPRLP